MNPRILIVDDTPLTRETLRLVLEADGYEVDAVDRWARRPSNCSEAVRFNFSSPTTGCPR